MTRRVREHDWGRTPLGPSERWPPLLRNALAVILESPLPTVLAWGAELIALHNDAYLPLLGGEPDALGRSLLDVWGEARETIAPHIARALAGEATRSGSIPSRLLPPDTSEEALFDHAFSPVRDETGAVAGILSTAVETTGRVLAERRRDAADEARRGGETCLRALVTAGVVSIYRMSPDWRFMHELDSATLAVTSGRIEDWPAKYLVEQDRPRVFAAVEQAIRTKSLLELEHRVRLADGSVGWVLSRAVPLLGPDGEISEWFGLVSDVTERRLADERLRESEERLALAFRMLPVGLAIVDTAGETVVANGEMRRFLPTGTMPSHDAERRGRWQAWDADGRAVLPEDFPGARALRGEDVSPGLQVLYQHDDTRAIWTEVRAAPLRSSDGQITGALVIVVDVDRLKRNEERQAFLLKLSDALRRQSDPVVIQETACRILGEHLGVDWAQYSELDLDRQVIANARDFYRGARGDLPSHVGEYDLRLYPAHEEAWRAGRSLAVEDADTDLALSEGERAGLRTYSVRAALTTPLVKKGTPVAVMAALSSVPRRWRAEDVALLEEAADHTWAAVERARAEARLRASEARLRGLAENSADVLWIADRSGTRLEYLSPAFERVFGEPRDAVLADRNRWRDLIHPDDRERVMSYMPRALKGETAVIHYRVVRPGDGRIVHLRDTGFLIRDAAGAIIQVAGIVQDVTDMVRAGEALEAEKERFRTLVEGIPQLVWRSGEDGSWTWSSPQWQAFTGQSQGASHGWGWLDAVHPDDREAARRAWHEARPHGWLDAECRVRRAGDGAWRWHATRSVPVRDAPEPDRAEGAVLEWLGTMTDIDDLKRLQAQQGMLVAELQHRTRNLLAVVRSVAHRSIDPSPGLDQYDARLAALGRVQGFLSRSPAYSVPLADLVEAELRALSDGTSSERAVTGGPVVELPGESVQTVALALHELATNAVKYGAIAQPSGRLSVTWRIEASSGASGGRRLVIDWRESGVAMPDGPPTRRGYGCELIAQALPYQLDAETDLAFTPDGVRCRIALPPGAFSTRSEAVRP